MSDRVGIFWLHEVSSPRITAVIRCDLDRNARTTLGTLEVSMVDTLCRKFLVVGHSRDNAVLIIRALSRKFPLCDIVQLNKTSEAIGLLSTKHVDAIVVHRAVVSDTVETVSVLRTISRAPIIALSGADRRNAILAAGATAYLNFDEWMLLGSIVANALRKPPPESNGPPLEKRAE
jgi:hypothetical protein